MSKQFDVAVIGSGPGGYVAAIRAAQLGMKTVCIEKQTSLGGTCLNVGCIPSKALLQSSEIYWNLHHHMKEHGLTVQSIGVDFKQMMNRKQEIVTSFNEGIKGLFKKNKITHISGHGTLLSANEISVSDEKITATHIILATGSEPIALPFLPFDERKVLSSTGALALTEIPKKMLVVGAGIIGVELGSVYSRLGTEVIFVEFLDKICPTLDNSVSQELQKSLETQGMKFHLSSKVSSATIGKEITLNVMKNDQVQQMSADTVLVSIGRKPYTQNLGLEKVGITPNARGFIPIDGQFRTQVPSIYAIGDIVDGPMLAHKASEEAVAVAEIIAGKSPKIEYAAIPNVVYTHPEVASVGLTEIEAKNAGISIKTGMFSFKANSRARCTGDTQGFVKILSDEKTARLIGIHIIGAHASELIAEAALALQKHCTIYDLIHTPHAHPTLSEAIKEAALDVEKRAIHK